MQDNTRWWGEETGPFGDRSGVRAHWQNKATPGAAAACVCLAMLLPRTASADCETGTPRTCGHRGAGNSAPGSLYPENTLEGLLEGQAQGAQLVELDVAMTADGVVVLMHDDTVDRTTDGTGCVAALDLADLRTLDAADGTAALGTGVGVPTLAEALEAVDIDLNVELKRSGAPCPEVDDGAYVDAVLEVVASDTKPRVVLLSSFSKPLLDVARSRDADIYLGYLQGFPTAASVDEAAAADFDAVHTFFGLTDEALVERAHAAGLDVNVWTINAAEDIERAHELGVDMVITDRPEVAESVWVDRCGPRVGETGSVDAGEGAPDAGGMVEEELPPVSDGGGCTAHPAAAAPGWAGFSLAVWGLWLFRRRRWG